MRVVTMGTGGSGKPTPAVRSSGIRTGLCSLLCIHQPPKERAASQCGFCFVLSVIQLFLCNELRTELAFPNQRASLLFTLGCVLWNITVTGLQILSKIAPRECKLFGVFKSVTFAHEALGDKSRHLIFTGYVANIPVYMLNFLKSHNLLFSCNT